MLTKADFAGAWQVRRVIDDRFSDQRGAFDGTATLHEDRPDRLCYDETGVMKIGNAPEMTATRRYFWQFTPDFVAVSFDDGRAFHRFTPQGHAAGSDHPCGADFYTVRYDFTTWPVWRAVWTVTGPRKNYVMDSFYRPKHEA